MQFKDPLTPSHRSLKTVVERKGKGLDEWKDGPCTKLPLTVLLHTNNEGLQRVWKEQWNRNTVCNKSYCDHRVSKSASTVPSLRSSAVSSRHIMHSLIDIDASSRKITKNNSLKNSFDYTACKVHCRLVIVMLGAADETTA